MSEVNMNNNNNNNNSNKSEDNVSNHDDTNNDDDNNNNNDDNDNNNNNNNVVEEEEDDDESTIEFTKTLVSDISDEEAKEYLISVKKKHPKFYKDFDDIDMEMLAKYFSVLKFEPNEEIIKEGEAATFMGILLEGDLKVQLHRLEVKLQKGALVGEMNYFDDGTRSATVVTCTPVIMAVVTYVDMHQISVLQPRLMLKLCKLLAKATIRVLKRINRRQKLELEQSGAIHAESNLPTKESDPRFEENAEEIEKQVQQHQLKRRNSIVTSEQLYRSRLQSNQNQITPNTVHLLQKAESRRKRTAKKLLVTEYKLDNRMKKIDELEKRIREKNEQFADLKDLFKKTTLNLKEAEKSNALLLKENDTYTKDLDSKDADILKYQLELEKLKKYINEINKQNKINEHNEEINNEVHRLQQLLHENSIKLDEKTNEYEQIILKYKDEQLLYTKNYQKFQNAVSKVRLLYVEHENNKSSLRSSDEWYSYERELNKLQRTFDCSPYQDIFNEYITSQKSLVENQLQCYQLKHEISDLQSEYDNKRRDFMDTINDLQHDNGRLNQMLTDEINNHAITMQNKRYYSKVLKHMLIDEYVQKWTRRKRLRMIVKELSQLLSSLSLDKQNENDVFIQQLKQNVLNNNIPSDVDLDVTYTNRLRLELDSLMSRVDDFEFKRKHALHQETFHQELSHLVVWINEATKLIKDLQIALSTQKENWRLMANFMLTRNIELKSDLVMIEEEANKKRHHTHQLEQQLDDINGKYERMRRSFLALGASTNRRGSLISSPVIPKLATIASKLHSSSIRSARTVHHKSKLDEQHSRHSRTARVHSRNHHPIKYPKSAVTSHHHHHQQQQQQQQKKYHTSHHTNKQLPRSKFSYEDNMVNQQGNKYSAKPETKYSRKSFDDEYFRDALKFAKRRSNHFTRL